MDYEQKTEYGYQWTIFTKEEKSSAPQRSVLKLLLFSMFIISLELEPKNKVTKLEDAKLFQEENSIMDCKELRISPNWRIRWQNEDDGDNSKKA